MPNSDKSERVSEKVAFLTKFKSDILGFFNGSIEDTEGLRTRISRTKRRARDILAETDSLKTMTLSPPPAVGGVMIPRADPFNFILDSYYGASLIPNVADMIDEAIGVLESPDYTDVPKPTEHFNEKPPGQKHIELALPEIITAKWLFEHAPVKFLLIAAGLALALLAMAFRLGQNPKAVDALSGYLD
ncbi:MAG: hypothetical protein M3R65_05290 [Gemmatimonadota bacterium]|nr:hypothetical protein [Gemmatimonadota bacterium]